MILLDEKEYKRWLEAALKTLNSAQGDLVRGDYNWACFKAQQAAELVLKGLTRGIGSPRYGHSVSRILEELINEIQTKPSPDIIECSKLLDKMCIPTRYPDAWSEGTPYYYYTEKDAKNAIECSEKVIKWVESQWRRLSSAVELEENK